MYRSYEPYIANQKIITDKKEVKGYLTLFEGETVYCIENYDLMDPFLMSVTSSSDLWMFVSSYGSLTCGRRNYNNSIFPYYTDDKIHESAEITGPKTIIRVISDERMNIWEPFSDRYRGLYDIKRNLYKNRPGTKLTFEEINSDLGLSFCYSWMSSDRLGWVRKGTLINHSGRSVEMDITDGLQNIIPFGITRETQSLMSTLMDAYKVSELLPGLNLALFRMSSIPVDRPEPGEALRTNCVWSCGFGEQNILLSSRQIDKIRFGGNVETEHQVYGIKTSYLIHADLMLPPEGSKTWYLIADVAKDSSDIADLQNFISGGKEMASYVEAFTEENSERLTHLVAISDGIQDTGDKLNDCRHFSNVIFNIMRGGVFESGYNVDQVDFLRHLESANIDVYNNCRELFSGGGKILNIEELPEIARSSNNKDLVRLTMDYLPLSFSRRHGDPSRPWNFFDISVRNPDGSTSLNYQGNWRDIFQNWEALAFSFPGFLPHMISRFLNSSTADGYNPYRVTRKGFDWEVPDPEDPWAHIGYWGDHQIIYLLKLLEHFEKFFPDQLFEKFSGSIFVYANVPYRIKPYREIVKNPQETILFNRKLHDEVTERSRITGSDGMLLCLSDGQILRAGFLEKILVTILTKLSNFVPGAGIWLNTQRPEWNDANNALVGNGASMVTLYHLKRFISFFTSLCGRDKGTGFEVSDEVISFFNSVFSVLREYRHNLNKGFTDRTRKEIVDMFGTSGCDYRAEVYKGFTGEKRRLEKNDLLSFFHLVSKYIDQSIAANKRTDGLYHSYNLLHFSDETLNVQPLQLMLEGQVAVLNSGQLNNTEVRGLIKSLFESELWRKDQHSFMLYPFRELPDFLDKNVIPSDLAERSTVLQELLTSGNNEIIRKDVNGIYHFNSDLKNIHDLKIQLDKLTTEPDMDIPEKEHQYICDIYESVFQHRFFTGRSGSFYKYEGLGCIYWHLVSKLLLALGDNIHGFSMEGIADKDLIELKDYYYRIKDGIGTRKSPDKYGAFPTDPYSHTPLMTGAQQPGLTGQVKEDILSRFNELGLIIEKGEIKILPVLLRSADFNEEGKGELEFTFCNTRFVFRHGSETTVTIFWNNKTDIPLKLHSGLIPSDLSELLFKRSGNILKVVVDLPATSQALRYS